MDKVKIRELQMNLFYFDDYLKEYEKNFLWNDALNYLERLYEGNSTINILSSLIGFSWYYAVEGRVESQQYDDMSCYDSLEIWKKYIDVGLTEYNDNPQFCFIAGYTLSLHGFFINEQYEQKGHWLIQKCFSLSHDGHLKEIANNLLCNMKKKKRLKDSESICRDLFPSESLLDKYFVNIYSN